MASLGASQSRFLLINLYYFIYANMNANISYVGVLVLVGGFVAVHIGSDGGNDGEENDGDL